MHQSILFTPSEDKTVQCQICQRECKIPPGKTGFCRTRKNVDGQLHSIIYGKVSSVRVSPVEIKPLFHFFPGSKWLSLGSLGCNFRCPGCQNWEISHADVAKQIPFTEYIPPEKVVQLAIEENCKGISWTYNEPTLWLEYTLDTAKIAKEQGLLINYVTNGYITTEAMNLLGPYLDAYRVDLKGFSAHTYKRIANVPDFKGILHNIRTAKYQSSIHVEIITNLTPGYNDDEDELNDMAHWIVNQLGPDTPWHITRFVPHYKLSHLDYTPVSQLEQARHIGIAQGLRYVYLGNVPGHAAENTYCPQCGNLIIKRRNYQILQYNLQGNKCTFCNQTIAGCFE
ncbi:MAG: AmmeMemoRadiSam system radical SAM enzyme [Deltaproteobacteria bacterium]|nr:AmmeMemoRadiSam system radical SAM enzyme [Deltaproteobacteria bacterium]MBW2339885.1 AmmeMemoRadiSam system radical SAM enzyme [Deltaproteobacteria bacterium]